MENNVTVGYALGMVEGYLEGRVALNDDGAATILEYFKVIEQAYKEKNAKVLEQQTKLEEIQLNLQGWKKA